MEYEVAFKVKATFGPEYQVKNLMLFEDSTYSYNYYPSITRSEYLLSNYDIHKYQKGKWFIKDDKIIFKPENDHPWKLIIGRRWNLYFVGLNDKRGLKFHQKRNR